MATNNVPKTYPYSFAVKALASLAAVAVLIFGALVAWSNPTFRSDIALATSKQPERYTALSFDKSLTLPTTVTPGRPYTFTYHVTNNEFAQVDYEADVTVSVNGVTEPLEIDHFTLSQGDSHDQIIHFLAPKAGTTMQFVVTLPGYNDSIYFRSAS